MKRLIGHILAALSEGFLVRWLRSAYATARVERYEARQSAYLAKRPTTRWLERGDQLKRYAAGQHEIDAQRGYVDWDEWNWLVGQFSHWGQCTLDYARKELKAPTPEGR